jgi:DNA-binding NtrC family response regulator
LFGHEKGAFTGAVARRIGKFEEANGGTLLLDEISEMDLRLQAKLLRAIQERVIDRVGGNQPVKVDIRIIATSNRNLDEAAAKGLFREDLLFRLNVVTLLLPPLRERPGDLEALAEHFIKKYSESNGMPSRRLSSAARQKLLAHTWRGNVRELENTLHRAVLLAREDEIEADAITLTASASQPAAGATPVQAARTAALPTETAARALVGSTVAEVERDLIIGTLYHCLGNRTHAANILGISIRTLRNKLKQYSSEGVSVPHPGEADRAAL